MCKNTELTDGSIKYGLKQCRHCQTIYKSQNYNSKYCSNSCRALNAKHKLKCDICSKEFTSKISTAKFCSNECRKQKPIKPKHKPIRECRLCGITGNVGTKYCKPCARSVHNKKPKSSSGTTLMALFKRDKFCCVYCGQSSIEDGVKLAGDHIIPSSRDGLNCIYNLVTSCKSCNSSKRDNLLDADIIERVITLVKKRNDALSVGDRLSLMNVLKIVAYKPKT